MENEIKHILFLNEQLQEIEQGLINYTLYRVVSEKVNFLTVEMSLNPEVEGSRKDSFQKR